MFYYILYISAAAFFKDELPVKDHPVPQTHKENPPPEVRGPAPYEFDDIFDSNLIPKGFAHSWVNGKHHNHMIYYRGVHTQEQEKILK